ncbi:UDP-N-acetylmuramoyl-tripeptide--D-alanyl-D-alanine ligase [Cardinium endosymbiont of Culicoides punctatus]|uniref:UDP-N-acetylmuramoyl-tripeptide--D-alanyl-D- alanine ligase n=1 Tax=Cardinium endosymbiont of Culicoides punctatus TaxID=2304601 RepID=UPI001058EFF4|nr:UDP-N-acetylmuramoyl-tripeptide--D-alanyl-D-alanine ligase [Cardinium endosymbiont of Culicoides punctatus]TDG93352.1 UDP-N-acetylmuramoyl-tripeptide--D-alanyl-D-alanine ligase [Cardinium endosymbiont of Culicoides punctatus]
MADIEYIYQKYLITRSVTIDARNVSPGSLFFAIRGTKFNGNEFAEAALAKGASYAIIDDPAYMQPSSAYILVEDSLSTLHYLANYHRRQYGIHFPVIGITGSYGKTTTKELIWRVLHTTYKTVATKGNLNTSIGVALTLLSMAQDTEIAVVEMGATQLKDIALCCSIAEPTHGIITAIGDAHLESFYNLEGIIQGKGELYNYLYLTQGIVFLNTLDTLLQPMSARLPNLVTYPQANDFAPLDLVSENPYLCYRSPEGTHVRTNLLGKPHIYNIAAALCVAKYFKVPIEAAHQAIQTYVPKNFRMELVVKGSNQLLIDSYNASPASMQTALDTLLQLKSAYYIAILGDMAELGSKTAIWHDKIIAQLCHSSYNLVLLCGPLFTVAASKKPHKNIHCFPNKEILVDYLCTRNFQHSAILLKGTNALAMHTLAEHIR